MKRARWARHAQAVESAMTRAAGSRPIPGNRVTPLIDGTAAYAAMQETIAGAREWVHFENYIIRSDSVGWEFARLLAARAREGVAVRVLYDWLGSFGTSRRYWRFLRDAGVEVRPFNPFRFINVVGVFSRNHRKLVSADGRRAVMGGLCIGCEWTDGGTPGGEPWRDSAVDVEGPAAAALDRTFAVTWRAAGGTLPEAPSAAEVPVSGDAEVRVIAGEPGLERAFRVIELLAAGALERLWITDAYLIAPPRLFQALRDAALDGVDVRLLVPGTSDIPLVRNLTRIGYRELLASGVRIFEWDGAMLHAKTVTSDSRWVRIGSSNINPASLVGNYELDVLVEDPGVAEPLEIQLRRDVMRSREVLRRPMRGPRRLAGRMPSTLAIMEPEAPVPRSRSRHERRHRAAVALRTVVGNARRSVYGPLSFLLVLLAALFIALPRPTAYAVGGLCAWFAVGAAREAFRRRADR
jgi:cardiolipin synthase